MTAIEFFDRTPVENIISSLTTVPDKIIYIGDGNTMESAKAVHKAFLENRGLNIALDYRSINRNSVNSIVHALTQIVAQEEQCVFDLTGGDDLVLVAMGIVFERFSHKNIQMQRFNVSMGTVKDCDNDGNVLYNGAPTLSVEELIGLHGGAVNHKKTQSWELTEDFVRDVELMWDRCRSDPGLWNSQVAVMKETEAFVQKDGDGTVSFTVDILREHLRHVGVKYVPVTGLLAYLKEKKLVLDYQNRDQQVTFRYKNEQVKQCLQKEGNLLELKVLVTAQKAKRKDGTPTYSDSMSGVFIDWDGQFHSKRDKEKDTENEIDVILMKGLCPVFISCKNGSVEDDELYKLSSVADRFGGTYVKKVLIATYVGKQADSMEYFRQRAEDMNIELIDGVHKLPPEQFEKTIRNLLNK